jgi:NAD(P)-dependent dehydrogenase (short-subunit alcohol dehydrogenase family)
MGVVRPVTDPLADLLGLHGRRVAVVGAGFGIGRSAARMLAAAGADLVLVDLDGNRVEELAAELVGSGARAVALAADVTAADQAVGVIRAAWQIAGPLDALVNIVGRGGSPKALNLTSEAHLDAMRMNYLHHVDCATEFARRCIEAAQVGTIAVVSSLAGSTPFPGQSAYGAAKAALNAFVASAAVEWGEHGIRVNAVAPGVVRTDRNRHEGTAERLAAAVPLGRLADQEEVAKALLFLVSDLSSYLTGQVLVLDGGAIRRTGFWMT